MRYLRSIPQVVCLQKIPKNSSNLVARGNARGWSLLNICIICHTLLTN